MKNSYIYLSVAALLFIAFNASAQTTEKTDPVKSYFSIYGGASMPMGNFKSNNYDNNKAGFAKTGVTFGIDGAVYFYKHLGVGATLSYQDQGELSTDNATNLANGYTTSYSADGATVSAVKRYSSASVLLGPQYSFSLGEKFVIDLRPQAGIIHSFSTPEITTSLVGAEAQAATFYQRSAKETVFGYGGYAGLTYLLSDHFGLTLRGAYIASPGFNITNDGRTTTTIGRYVTRQPVNALQGTLGLNFRF